MLMFDRHTVIRANPHVRKVLQMLNILTEPLIRFDHSDGKRKESSLPEIYAVLMADEVEAFPALRPHQRHAWHAFLVQLGAMAMLRAGLDTPPETAGEWVTVIMNLTPDWPDDEPWQLVVNDITQPAFMQPPARAKEREQDYKNAVATPDALDMLVTSRNHELKAEVAERAQTEDWVFALITLQTMEGFGGAGNYGISRMNGGLGNRPAFSLTPVGQRPGPHVRRDVGALLEFLPDILAEHPGTDSGSALLWTLPWDGNEFEALLLSQLHPLYVETCRRVRLRTDTTGRILGARATSKATRIEAKSLNGLTGDPWAPVDRRDKKGDKVLTVPGGGFHFRRVSDYLTSGGEYARPTLMQPTASEMASDEPMEVVARAMVRGQGKTEGYHERKIPVRHRFKSAMLRRNSNNLADIGDISQARINDVGRIQRILSHAIQVFAARGEHDRISPEQRERARTWLNRLDEIVDATFFEDLQDEFEAEDSERQGIRNRWLLNDEHQSGVINHARTLLYDAEQSLPCPTIYYYKAREAAEGLFEGRLRGNGGLPELFRREQEEAEV